MAELLTAGVAHVWEVVVMDTHVAVPVGVATKASVTEVTGVGFLPTVNGADVVDERGA